MTNKLPGMFTLVNGTKMVQTSGHGASFSDGTIFSPSEEEKIEIQNYYKFLQVDRTFSEVPAPIPGLKLSHSSQEISSENLRRIRELVNTYPDVYFLVSFMVISALNEMDLRDNFPTLIAGNATRETSRAKPDEKIWDVENMAY